MPRIRTLLSCVLTGLLFGAAIASCSEHPGGNAEKRPPTAEQSARIAALSPAISILLVDLGLDHLVVGRHAFDDAVDPSIPVVGDQTGIDYERLARAEPTHVLIQQTAQDVPALLMDIAQRRGWSVESFPLLALHDIPAAIERLGEMFREEPGVRSRADALFNELERAFRPHPDAAARAGRTLVVYWTSPVGVAGPGSFHHDLLLEMGFDAVPSRGGPYITMDAEDLTRLDPDSILLLTPGVDESSLPRAIEPWRKLDLRAVREGRVAPIGDPRALTPSSAMIDLAAAILDHVKTWTPPGETTDPETG